MAWTLDEIAELNQAGPSQSRSRIELLRTAGALMPAALCETASEIEARDTPHVALLFQVPFRLQLEQHWHRLSALEEGVSCDLKTFCAVLVSSPTGQLALTEEESQSTATALGANVTQIATLFPVWGIRARFFEKYRTYVEQDYPDTTSLISQKDSWIDNRPITVRDFEVNFAGRLLRETHHVVRSLFPAISILTRTEIPVPAIFYACQAMLLPGRLRGAGTFVPVVNHYLEAFPKRDPGPIRSSELKRVLNRKYRELGRFEAQLFALERLRCDGEVALALIGTVSLIEWLLNSHIGRRRKNYSPSLGQLVTSDKLDFLSVDTIEFLKRITELRNEIVHGAPPDRYQITIGQSASLQGREQLGQSSSDEVRTLILRAFDIFRTINERRSASTASEFPTS